MKIKITFTAHQFALATLGAASIGLSLEAAISQAALLTEPIPTRP